MSQSFDINVLREEARSRWLKPSEVYYILQNHERFPITHEAPKKPPSGSLFLYNRRVNRYFRRDGHTWRRKKDGRTVGEAHERLKVYFRRLSIALNHSSCLHTFICIF
ncbi:Calmodulin-binding transcription activator 4 [Zea mays]|uniref:Calmodulin-binding transcription activator 4 n=1 Tax=Zea mays TaxID=4577 RepID=A0A1D6J5M9_MAIZE|nr:Calmodulin-binding transcription activator 4 [Zea mays]AQK43251.1 Calmodulin-binding transcription activator 4 [Zea mays]